MNRLLLSTIVLSSLGSVALAQEGFVGQGNTAMLLIDPTGSGSSTTYGWSQATGTGAGASRGHYMGHDGKVYRSAWTLNGIVVNDWQASTPTVTNLVNDTTNLTMGAPYQPCPDWNHKGGPGLVDIDGNPAPSPAPSGNRNWFTVKINSPATFAVDGYFANSNVPMSDCFPHPYDSKKILTVGFSTSDLKIDTWELPGSLSLFTPSNVLTLTNRCTYDAFIHEDQKLYCWTSVAGGNIGFQVVDLAATPSPTQTFVAVKGMTHLGAGYACVWNDPFEEKGRMCYVLQDSTSSTVAEKLYRVDLLASGGPQATLVPLVIPAGAYNTGRSIEDGQLTTWKHATNPLTRIYHINFGTVNVGDGYFLFPTIAGYEPDRTKMIVVDGQEIFIKPDIATILAASGAIPGTLGVFTTTNGEKDITITLPPLGVDVVWACALIQGGKVTDVSNYILVGI